MCIGGKCVLARKEKKIAENVTDTKLVDSITNDDILKYIVSNDIIDLPSIEGSLIMAEKKKYFCKAFRMEVDNGWKYRTTNYECSGKIEY